MELTPIIYFYTKKRAWIDKYKIILAFKFFYSRFRLFLVVWLWVSFKWTTKIYVWLWLKLCFILAGFTKNWDWISIWKKVRQINQKLIISFSKSTDKNTYREDRREKNRWSNPFSRTTLQWFITSIILHLKNLWKNILQWFFDWVN